MDEQRHVALPMLRGAPAYARPAPTVAHTTRPFDPDDLPLVAVMSEEERRFLEHGPTAGAETPDPVATPQLRARPFSLRALTNRIRIPRG